MSFERPEIFSTEEMAKKIEKQKALSDTSPLRGKVQHEVAKEEMINSKTSKEIESKTASESTEKPQPEQELSEKQKRSWQEKLKALDDVADRMGLGIDEKIKETVVAFNAFGVETSQSCYGHADHGLGAPWVRGGAPNRPKERYIEQEEIYKKIAEKYKISIEDVKVANNQDAWVEANGLFEHAEETPEYKKWRNDTRNLANHMREFIDEFYKGRKVPPDAKLELDANESYGFELHNGGENYRPIPENLTEEEKSKLSERLKSYQEEMRAFTEFLKRKYFSSIG